MGVDARLATEGYLQYFEEPAGAKRSRHAQIRRRSKNFVRNVGKYSKPCICSESECNDRISLIGILRHAGMPGHFIVQAESFRFNRFQAIHFRRTGHTDAIDQP